MNYASTYFLYYKIEEKKCQYSCNNQNTNFFYFLHEIYILYIIKQINL